MFINPSDLSAPVVLNDFAISILNAFIDTSTIQDVISRFPNVEENETIEVVNNLITTKLLISDLYQSFLNPSNNVLTAWLHVTNECNLRCDYCYITKTPDKMEIEQGKQSVDAVFRSAIANGFQSVKLKFSGGESTMNFSLLLELYDYARSQALEKGLGLAGVVLTNGVGITERMIDALQERKIKLSISLDGVGEYHDAQRKFINGKGSFNLVERSLDSLAAR